MKLIILFTLVFAPLVFAKTKVPDTKEEIQSAVSEVGSLNEVATSVGKPVPTCTEEQHILNRDTLVKDNNIKVIQCRPDASSFTEPTGEDYSSLIRDYNIEFHPNQAAVINTRDFRLFVYELKKFPPALMKEMAGQGGKIRVMIGNGVSEDPEWEQERLRALGQVKKYRDWYNSLSEKNKIGKSLPETDEEVNRGYTSTTEGTRNWDVVSGAGGIFMNPKSMSPTRVVINRMYRSAHRFPDGSIGELDQGATNLFLHEHGHALDNLYGHHNISSSPQWKAVIADPKVKIFADKIFSTYESGFEEEGFAEAFSYYHSCEASRSQMEQEAPVLAEFFKNFTTVRALRPDIYQDWVKRNKK